MVVGTDFKVVVHPAHHKFAGEDISQRSVFEHDMERGKVFDIRVIGAQMAFVPEPFHPGDGVNAR